MKRFFTLIAMILVLLLTSAFSQGRNVKIYKAVSYNRMEECAFKDDFKPCLMVMEYDIGTSVFKIYTDKTFPMTKMRHLSSYIRNGSKFSEYKCIDYENNEVIITFITTEEGYKYIALYFGGCDDIIFRLE